MGTIPSSQRQSCCTRAGTQHRGQAYKGMQISAGTRFAYQQYQDRRTSSACFSAILCFVPGTVAAQARANVRVCLNSKRADSLQQHS